ncbi:hypothetical protein D9756_009334 [Leucocoprinus leucothites]|uniref:Nephrocystin 3-like N-terminal domain-containing protein n=1 Tax=Leucocoprinus leucothites TaxID=201217 RepID=A0A8H5CWB1_9AGAR|nr:hypothetical protein D9756_009334 [Leucoagaricus leucothites]
MIMIFLAPFELGSTRRCNAAFCCDPPPFSHLTVSGLSQACADAMFHSAHHIVISGSKFIDASPPSNGLKELLKYSMPDAFHDSSARYPPPKCHPSTRKDYIDEITKWALSAQGRVEPILWLYGPFGVGKSAIAQSCAMYLERVTILVATLFFSRANPNREDPNRVFTSIAYQIATKCQVFSEILDTRIQQDPAVFTKSLPKQFEELLVQPLKQVGSATREFWLEGGTIIIDGLDECKGAAAQHAIVDIIAISVRDRTTPFRWFITSRSEANIFRTMKSSAVSAVSSHLELPVSREIDYQILLYLTDEFTKIREFHQLLPSWPSEDHLALLVAHAAGLFIYAATIIRFINDENSFGPEDQLRIVLKYVMTVSAKAGEANPLAEMDSLYILIVERIPPNLRLTVKRILFIHSLGSYFQGPITIASILNISVDQFRRCCTFIQSVMELRGETLNTMSMHFYHTSFLDFMKDPKRSKEFCIRGDFLIEYRRELLEWLHEILRTFL